jgi:hypothetical protein
MALWTAAAPLLVDLAERAFKALVVEEPCTHAEEEKCDKDKHVKPTPIGALLLLGLMFFVLGMGQIALSIWSQTQDMGKDVTQLKTDVADIKNFLAYGRPLYHAQLPVASPTAGPNPGSGHLDILPSASADENYDYLPY